MKEYAFRLKAGRETSRLLNQAGFTRRASGEWTCPDGSIVRPDGAARLSEAVYDRLRDVARRARINIA